MRPHLTIKILFLLLFQANWIFAQYSAKLNISQGLSNASIKATANTTFDIGSSSNIFDGNTSTLARTPSVNPMTLRLEFPDTITFLSSRIYCDQEGLWTIEMAKTLADMTSKTGSYKVVFANEKEKNGEWAEKKFTPFQAKVVRLTLQRTVGDDYVHLNEWELNANVSLDSIYIKAVPENLNYIHPFTDIYLKTWGFNKRFNVSFVSDNFVSWSVNDEAVAKFFKPAVLTGISHGVVKAMANVGSVVGSVEITVKPDDRSPDCAVAYVKRWPVINYVKNSKNPETEGWPAVGEEVTWCAWIKNWSPNTITNLKIHWYFDDQLIDSGYIFIDPYKMQLAEFKQKWEFVRHEIVVKIDPYNEFPDLNRANNQLLFQSDAISANIYVEQAFYDYFRRDQFQMNAGTNCFEDWIQQLHISRLNMMLEKAVYPITPFGVYDRIRIDSIIVVKDEALPLKGGSSSTSPNKNDLKTDLQFGFPYSALTSKYTGSKAISDKNAFYYDYGFLQNLLLARYIIKSSDFNVTDNGNGQTIGVMENNKYIGGSSWMPYILSNNVHLTPYKGLMANDDYTIIDEYTAAALNQIKGHRAVDGNYNKPANSAIYLNDLPAENCFIFKNSGGELMKDAVVTLYRCINPPGNVGKHFDNESDDLFVTDSTGKICTDKCPFAENDTINGVAEGLLIFRIEKDGMAAFSIFESSVCNLAFWAGDSISAEYLITVNLKKVVGIEEDFDKTAFFAYPNPANSLLNVYSKNGISSVMITDLSGKVVYEESALNPQNKALINTETFSKGIYLMKLRDINGTVYYQKIMISK